jgi:hypothetical protein
VPALRPDLRDVVAHLPGLRVAIQTARGGSHRGFATVKSMSSTPTRTPNIAPDSFSVPRINDDGHEELCHLVADTDPDTALCGKDVTDYPWNPPWPFCQACLAVERGGQN